MSEELKPCPFCGGAGVVIEGMSGWIAGCCECLVRALSAPSWEQAAELWNRRAEPAPAPLLTEADALRAELREMGRFADALETRMSTLERVAGFGPRAGDGYREIPAGERGEEE